MFDLTGKSALVTGAASGIGESIAKTLAAAGAFVYVADRDSASGLRVAGEIGASNAAFLPIDVANASECRNAADVVLHERDGLDVLVNNAGIGHVGTLLDTSEEDLERLFAVNVRGVFSMTKAFLPSMIANGGGSIINIASIGGILAIRDRLAYCTTKFAVVGFTKAVALDHARQGIRANAICPGRVETPFVTKLLSEYEDPEKAYAQMSSTQAVGRMGKPEEIAAATLYLASDESAFVTGTALEIDGGWAAGR